MDLEALKNLRLPAIDHHYTEKDTILYALGIGYGDRPADPSHLQFLLEDRLAAAPSMVNILAHPGLWVSRPELRLDWRKLLHGEQAFEIFRPIAPTGHVRGEYEVVAVEDRGVEKGAVLHLVKHLSDLTTGDRLATVNSLYMLRGDGGHGGFGVLGPSPDPVPNREPDRTIDVSTLPQAALIYRLSGDYNPIHADPEIAAKAGFAAPILHGLCTLGIAGRALLEGIADNDPGRLASLAARFSRPVVPGETLKIEIFAVQNGFRFRVRSIERDIVVLDRGSARLT